MNHEPLARDFHCIPWSVNFIDRAVSLLCTNYGNISATCCDLRKHLVVLPSDRACDDFESQLSAYMDRRNLRLIKPQIITPAKVPESLFSLPSNVVTESHGLLLATIAAVEVAEDEREPVSARLRQAMRLLTLRRELSSACIAFEDIETLIGEYDVPARVLEELESFKHLNILYLNKVADAGLFDLDSFLLHLLRSPREKKIVRTIERVHLLACPELKEILVRGLAYAEASVSVYIYAPQECRERFDTWGRLNPAMWKEVRITIPDNALIVVDQSFQQIDAVSVLIAHTENPVTIVACDRSLADSMKSGLVHEGYNVECTVSAENGETSLVTLLDVIMKLPVSGARELGNFLFKHPDILRWFDVVGEPPYSRVALAREWDAFLLNHLPGPAYSLREFFADERVAQYEALAIATKLISRILPLDGSTGELDVEKISEFLENLYGIVSVETRQKEYLNGAFAEWNELKKLEGASGEIFLSVFRHSVKDKTLIKDESTGPDENTDRKVTIVGWLDGALDRSPTILLTSFNEGIVPEPQRFDYLLPDSVREKLGLPSGTSRDIRDKYVLMSIIGTEKTIKFLASRTIGNGEGALLSRLLLSQSSRDNARLILEFFGSSRPAPRTERQWRPFRVLPQPAKEDTISIVPVSGLTAYKACPYRFYLRYVLGITPVYDLPREIDGAGFGRIVHQILKDLLLYEAQKGGRDVDLKRHASRLIDDIFEREFGTSSFPAVSMQMDRLRIRIERFLEQHSRIRDEGWETISLEDRLQACVVVPGRGASVLPIRGQIDRIDVHWGRKEARIYDYKTGEDAKKTESYHMKKGQIVNFQLPAYRHLLERNRDRIGIGDMNISVAIYNISAQADDTVCEPGGWSDEEYRAIDNEIFDILEKIRAGEFSLVADGEDSYSWLIS